MSKTIIETTNARIDDLIATRDAEIASAEKALDDAKAAVAEAQARADAAISATDVDAYDAACEDVKKAERAVAVYAARMDQMRGNRIITAAEDATVVASIRAHQKDLRDAATAEIIALLSRVEEIGKQYYADQDAANELIWRWHSKVCPQQNPRSAGLTVYPSDLHAQDTDLRVAIQQIVTQYFYREQVGADQYHGAGSFWTK